MRSELPVGSILTATVRRVAHVMPHSSANPWLEDLVVRLPGHSWEPLVITVAQEGAIHAALRENGIPSLSLGSHHRSGYPLAITRLAGILRDVTLVHAHLFDGSFLAWLASSVVRRPFVITRHEGPDLIRRAPDGGVRRRLYDLLDATIVRSSTAVIAPSEAVRADVIRLGAAPARVHKILLGIDLQRLERADRTKVDALRSSLAPGRSFLAVAVGRLSWEKQIEILLAAWKRVIADRPDAALLIVGDGPQRANLVQLANDLGIAWSVRFLGSRSDAAELMLCADVVAHASLAESTGLVILEALALGRPLVTTPVGVVNEYLLDGVHCRVVPAGDPVALATGILAVAADPIRAVAMASRGRVAVTERSSIDAMVTRYAALYDESAPESTRP